MTGLSAAAGHTRRHAALTDRAIETIASIDETRACVMWSGGKDSTVLADLAHRAWQHPLLVSMGESQIHDRHRLHLAAQAAAYWPAFTVLMVVNTTSDEADRFAALRRALDRLSVTDVLLGLRASESTRRKRIANTLARTGSYTTADRWGRRTAHCPLLHWTHHDIWTHIDTHRLPTHPVYDHEHGGRTGRSPNTPRSSP